MSLYRVSYSWTDRVDGDADAIRKALRDLSFSPTLEPANLANIRVIEIGDSGQYIMSFPRTVSDEIAETSVGAALRKFLYSMELPNDIDMAKVHCERVDGRGASADPMISLFGPVVARS